MATRKGLLFDGPMKSRQHLRKIAATQHGAFTRAQALAAGFSDSMLHTEVAQGHLERFGARTYLVAGTEPTPLGSLAHVILDVGAPVWATGSTAAAMHRLLSDTRLDRPFQLAVPYERSVSPRASCRIRRLRDVRFTDTIIIDGIPTLAAARTLIELAKEYHSAELMPVLEEAIARGRVSEDALHRRIVDLRSQGRVGVPTLHEVLGAFEVVRGGESFLERRYLRLLADAGLPRPEVQAVLSRARDRLVRVDCRFRDTNVVVELLGYRFHRTSRQMSIDARRYNALLAKGFQPYQFTYQQVVTEADEVIATTRAALVRAAG